MVSVQPTSGTTVRPASLQRDDSSIASGSSGFGSLTKKKTEKPPEFYSNEMDPAAFISSIVTDSGISESSDVYSMHADIATSAANAAAVSASLPVTQQQLTQPNVAGSPGGDLGHSRNSSNTSQVNHRRVLSYCSAYCLINIVSISDVQRIGIQ